MSRVEGEAEGEDDKEDRVRDVAKEEGVLDELGVREPRLQPPLGYADFPRTKTQLWQDRRLSNVLALKTGEKQGKDFEAEELRTLLAIQDCYWVSEDGRFWYKAYNASFRLVIREGSKQV